MPIVAVFRAHCNTQFVSLFMPHIHILGYRGVFFTAYPAAFAQPDASCSFPLSQFTNPLAHSEKAQFQRKNSHYTN